MGVYPKADWSIGMKSQSEVERMLREIHVMVAQAATIPGNDNQVILNKNQLFEILERINLCMYDMMDQYEKKEKSKATAVRQVKMQTEEMLEDASKKAEDIYSASIMYSDDAIGRVIRILEDAQTSMDETVRKAQLLVEEEKSIVRMNQRELQEQLLEMQDSNLYKNLIEERRKKTENANPQNRAVTKELSKAVISHLQNSSKKTAGVMSEIKVNPEYFEKTGRSMNYGNTDAFSDEVKVEKADVKVNLDSEYFKRKQGGTNGEEK